MKKIALVTGASSGIGAETVKELLLAGYVVYAGARRTECMDPLESAGARLLPLDLTSDRSLIEAAQTVLRETSRLDLLVNNAGYGSYGSVEEVPLDEARRQFEVNLFGLARLIQLFLPTMRHQASGRIINVSSVGGEYGEPLGGWYHASKFALEGFSDSLRMEMRPFGVDVVVIQPGRILTQWSLHARESLLNSSAAGPYRETASAQVKMMATADRGLFSSSAGVVAKTIVRAARARKPNTRYATGGGAPAILFLRHLLSDRAWDAVLRLKVRLASRSGN